VKILPHYSMLAPYSLYPDYSKTCVEVHSHAFQYYITRDCFMTICSKARHSNRRKVAEYWLDQCHQPSYRTVNNKNKKRRSNETAGALKASFRATKRRHLSEREDINSTDCDYEQIEAPPIRRKPNQHKEVRDIEYETEGTDEEQPETEVYTPVAPSSSPSPGTPNMHYRNSASPTAPLISDTSLFSVFCKGSSTLSRSNSSDSLSSSGGSCDSPVSQGSCSSTDEGIVRFAFQ